MESTGDGCAGEIGAPTGRRVMDLTLEGTPSVEDGRVGSGESSVDLGVVTAAEAMMLALLLLLPVLKMVLDRGEVAVMLPSLGGGRGAARSFRRLVVLGAPGSGFLGAARRCDSGCCCLLARLELLSANAGGGVGRALEKRDLPVVLGI